MEPGVKKKTKRKSLTQRSLEEARKSGLLVGTVERWVMIPGHPGGGVRKDLFGLFDLIAIKAGEIIGIQSTGYTSRSKHIADMLANENLGPWLAAGGAVELWTWKKKQVNGHPRYECRKEIIQVKKDQIHEYLALES